MENPEHKIKEAFTAKDANTVFVRKGEMWGRLDNAMNKQKGVAPFWRIAAVFFGLLLTAGVFAGVNLKAKMQQEKLELKAENKQLQLTVDSLLILPAKVQTETRVVERVVYRDRPGQVNTDKNNQELRWKQKYRQLQDSAEAVLSGHFKQYKSDLLQLQAELDTVKADFIAYKNSVENQKLQCGNDPFQLKSERVELGIQKKQEVKSPEMKVKVFPLNFSETSRDINKSIFKNKP